MALLFSAMGVDAAGFQKGVSKSQLYRLDPRAESTSVLIETISELMKNHQLEEAIPFLEEALIRLEGDPDRKAIKTRAFTLFTLASNRMQLGDYQQAAEEFALFGTLYPEDLQVTDAHIMSAQCYTMLGLWAEAEAQAVEVLAVEGLGPELKIAATKLQGESLYQQGKWDEAVKPLLSLFRTAKVERIRSSAAVMLVTSFVRLNDFDNLFKFLPHCDASARYDILLNVALLESGDEHYKLGEFQKALMLYRLVMLKGDLESHYVKLLGDLKKSMKPFVADGKMTMEEHANRYREQELLFKRKAKQLMSIREFKDYDMDVALRIAQAYGDLDRNWPAYTIYQHIYTEYPTNSLAEQSRFSAFGSMLSEQEWGAAIEEGYGYVELLPEGEFVDDITLNLLQLHMQLNQIDQAYSMGIKALELSPQHKYIDQVKYLLGYIKFTKMDYAESLVFFDEVLKRWPDSRYYESTEYWRGMSLLFLGEFSDAVVAFDAYLTNPKYETRRYEEDSRYRLGIAQYGSEQYVESEATFRLFVDLYPDSTLVSEAYSMLGDLRGAEGDLIVAVDFFKLAISSAINMSQRNYPTFQIATIYEKQERYTDTIALMVGYLKEWGAEGDYSTACKWQVKSYKKLDQYERALEAYFSSINAFGDQPELSDVDLILHELVKDYTGEGYEAFREVISEFVMRALAKARDNNQRTLALRYETVLVKILEGAARDEYIASVVQEKNVAAAGPLTLLVMAQEGLKQKQFGLVHDAYNRFMAISKVSNNMLYVMLAEMDALAQDGRPEDAIALSEEILHKFGHSPSVAIAWKKRGDVYRQQLKYDEAIEAYNYLLGIREWRGPLTPEGHYWLGVCKLAKGNVQDAYAHFQRVYVLYEDYTEWVAPAYARSIECLKTLGETQYILNTYNEMLRNEAVAATPEGKAARIELDKLQAGGSL